MSVIFADPGELYAMAERIARRADAVRSNARMLAAAIATDRWRGLAAEVFAAETGSVLKDMWMCARRLDDAADALRRHAHRVQGVLDFVKHACADVEGWGATVVREAGGFVVGGGEAVSGAVADMLTGLFR
jgi:uncharacterized protein YukE